MYDYIRESTSYYELFKEVAKVKKEIKPEYVSYGSHKDQYFLYYEPETPVSDKVIFWVHGGGWNQGNPNSFDFVGQCAAKAGYRFVSAGYRLSPFYKYPCQIIDVCRCYNAAMGYLKSKDIAISKVVVSGPSAGAHLSSIMCYNKGIQRKMEVDVSNIIGFIGVGGPYSFHNAGFTLTALMLQLFKSDYNTRKGEPVVLMNKSNIPMLLIQSKHDGLIDFSCAEEMAERAKELGIKCEVYEVEDEKNTHSWYTAGMFTQSREESKTLDKFFSWIENI